MPGLLILALLAVQAARPQPPPPAPPRTLTLDARCLRLMMDLAEDRDPRVQGLGRMGGQYFLGRIDAADPGFDADALLDTPAPTGAERERLIGQCGDAMQAGGRDFRTIGRALAPSGQPRP